MLYIMDIIIVTTINIIATIIMVIIIIGMDTMVIITKAIEMYIIRKLWYDTMENRNAFGYENFAITNDQELIDQLRKRTIPISDAPWPLEYVDLRGDRDVVDVYKIDKIKELTLQDMDI